MTATRTGAIYLVRHGEDDWNANGIKHGRESDRPLTPHGASQAWQAGLELAAIGLSDPAILCSPARRARHTAEILRHAACITTVPQLSSALHERSYTDNGWAESCESAAERASHSWQHWTGDLVVVTHAGVIRGLLEIATPPNGSVHLWQP